MVSQTVCTTYYRLVAHRVALTCRSVVDIGGEVADGGTQLFESGRIVAVFNDPACQTHRLIAIFLYFIRTA